MTFMAYTAKDYVLPEGLEHALEGAMALRQPLLLTGEPGTGKTTLADPAKARDASEDGVGGCSPHHPLAFNRNRTAFGQHH